MTATMKRNIQQRGDGVNTMQSGYKCKTVILLRSEEQCLTHLCFKFFIEKKTC